MLNDVSWSALMLFLGRAGEDDSVRTGHEAIIWRRIVREIDVSRVSRLEFPV